VFLVLVLIFTIPIIVYGFFASFVGASIPEGVSPVFFLLSVLVSKLGTALAFVLIFYFARNFFSAHWFLYALIWWLMFVIGEIGQTIGLNYSWKEAVAGVISETIYFPIATLLVRRLLK